ncbi:MAG: hypothetical protein ACRDAX_07730 [Propionibacteriaceae bacterium]
MTSQQRLRRVLNWSNGSTLLGLGIARLGHTKLRCSDDGLWIAEGYHFSFPYASAFTVGDVIITALTLEELESTLPHALAHEEQHSRQWAYCWGIGFLPAYLLSMAWSWITTGDRAAGCFFEKEAGLATGGYCEYPRRKLRR